MVSINLQCSRTIFAWLLILFAPLSLAGSIQKPAIPSTLASQVLLTGSSQLPNKAGFIGVGIYGHIVTSENGKVWHQAQSPVQVLLTNVFFLNDKLGWAVGHDAVILHTKDAGRSWQLQYEDPIPGGDLPKPLLDVYFENESEGFAVGAFGLMLKTSDAGKHWVNVPTETLYEKLENLEMEPEPNFNSVIPLGNKLLIAGELGTILLFDPQATEEELRWKIIKSPYEGSFFGAKQAAEHGLYLYGLRGNIFHSLDQGESWQKLATGVVTSLYDCIEMPNGELLFVGSNGTILSLDVASNTIKKQPYAGFDSLVSAQVIDDKSLLLFGTSGVKQVVLD